MLLASKLSPPRVRSPFLERDHVDLKFKDGIGYPLLLVASEAGSGKTAHVAHWLSKESYGVAWVTLDEDDNDPARFWSYVVQAIHGALPDLDCNSQTVLRPTHVQLEDTIDDLLAKVALSRSVDDSPLVLVLDDYHSIDSADIDRSLGHMIDRLPEVMRIILITRREPELSISRRRVARSIYEIGYDDLRFNDDEAVEYLARASGITLSADNGRLLASHVEGWIAGLQLAVLSIQKHPDPDQFVESFSGGNRLVADYLTDEILDGQSKDTREFLLATSILTELRPDVCSHTLECATDSECRTMLRYLDQENLFVVPLDDDRELYRYHQLFASSLQKKLEREHPGLSTELHRRAARWYAGIGNHELAFWHARNTDDVRESVDVIEGFVDELLWRTSEYATLATWLSKIPDEVRMQRPKLGLAAAWMAVLSGKFAESDAGLANVAEAIERLDSTTAERQRLIAEHTVLENLNTALKTRVVAEDKMRLVAECIRTVPPGDPLKEALLVGLGETFCRVGQLQKARETFDELVGVSRKSGNQMTLAMSWARLNDIAFINGDLNEGRRLFGEARRAPDDKERRHPMAVASTAWLSVKMLYDEGELERAELAAIDGIDRVASVNPWFVHALWLQLALIRAARGNIGGAMQAGRTSVELRDAYSMYSDWSVLSKDALMALLYLRSGDVRSARYWIDRADLALDNLAFTEERDAVVFGQVLSAEGEARRASRLLDRLAVRARDGGRYRCFLEARVAGALAVVRGDEGEHERAVELLVEALEVAAPHGFVTLFVDSAAPMEDLLKSAAQVRRVRPYARMLLSRMATSPERPFVITMDRASRMVDPGESFVALTHRETEVLALLAMGYSNKEVADLMSLSPHTIKAHTRNIYGKLGVNSRVQAIVRAKELRLLTG